MLRPDGVSEEELLTYAYALEQKSEHPLARAVIVKAGEYSSLQKFDADGFQAVPGNGLSGKVNGSVVCGGNLKFIRQSAGISEETEETAAKLAEEGKTPLFFSRDGKLIGIIAVADVIKEDSPAAIRELQNMGIHVVMLTGDNERTAKAIALRPVWTKWSRAYCRTEKRT